MQAGILEGSLPGHMVMDIWQVQGFKCVAMCLEAATGLAHDQLQLMRCSWRRTAGSSTVTRTALSGTRLCCDACSSDTEDVGCSSLACRADALLNTRMAGHEGICQLILELVNFRG